jgi:hypothetical protein
MGAAVAAATAAAAAALASGEGPDSPKPVLLLCARGDLFLLLGLPPSPPLPGPPLLLGPLWCPPTAPGLPQPWKPPALSTGLPCLLPLSPPGPSLGPLLLRCSAPRCAGKPMADAFAGMLP